MSAMEEMTMKMKEAMTVAAVAHSQQPQRLTHTASSGNNRDFGQGHTTEEISATSVEPMDTEQEITSMDQVYVEFVGTAGIKMMTAH